MSPQPDSGRLTRALIALEILLAIGAYGGAYGLILSHWKPGSFLSLDELQGTPFSTWLIPGIVLLLASGVLPTVVAVGAMLDKPWAHWGHPLVGLVLTVWILVQVAFIGFSNFLQPIYLAWGVVALVLGLVALRR
jgi:hypothetical protein